MTEAGARTKASRDRTLSLAGIIACCVLWGAIAWALGGSAPSWLFLAVSLAVAGALAVWSRMWASNATDPGGRE